MFRFSIPPLIKTPRLLVIREISSLPCYSITLLYPITLLPETMRKLCLSTKFPPQEIR